MFEQIIELIGKHPKYNDNMTGAVEAKKQLILNYHTHGGPSGYCVQIAVKKEGGLPVLGQPIELEELVHIKGVGQTPEQCEELMGTFGKELVAHYKLETEPAIFMDGRPFQPNA